MTAKAASPTPKWSAVWRVIRPAGKGRLAVRFILASRSASYHWFSAPAAPAPSAMHSTAAKPSTGWTGTGAASNPHSPVKTTRLITRGLVGANRSRQSAGRLWSCEIGRLVTWGPIGSWTGREKAGSRPNEKRPGRSRGAYVVRPQSRLVDLRQRLELVERRRAGQ